jgi:hypothetical protein
MPQGLGFNRNRSLAQSVSRLSNKNILSNYENDVKGKPLSDAGSQLVPSVPSCTVMVQIYRAPERRWGAVEAAPSLVWLYQYHLLGVGTGTEHGRDTFVIHPKVW